MFKRFPKIKDFRSAIKHLHKTQAPQHQEFFVLPKMHGTNAGICFKDGELIAQSRNRTLTLEKDHCGFALFVHQHAEELLEIFGPEDKYVYGEFVGPGIQDTVALNDLSRRYFVAFLILEDGAWHIPSEMRLGCAPSGSVRLIDEFPFHVYAPEEPGSRHFTAVTLDINDPADLEATYQTLVEEFVDTIEDECIVAKGLEGLSGVGEGIVCVQVGSEGAVEDRWFKVKGPEHSKASKGSRRDAEGLSKNTKQYGNAAKFMSDFFHEERMSQAVDYLREMGLPLDKTSTKAALDWATAEFNEEADGLVAVDFSEGSGAEPKTYYSALNGVFVTRLHRHLESLPLDTPE